MKENDNIGGLISKREPSKQIRHRIRRLQEDILSNEALGSAYLDQTAAEEMLSWSLSGAVSIASETDGMDDDEAEMSMADRLKALRKLMRHLGRLLGEGKDMGENDRKWLWNSIKQQAGALYGDGLVFPSLNDVMEKLESGEAPQQIISGLRNLFETKKN